MSDYEWHDITRYNLSTPRKSMIKLYNIKSISHHCNMKVLNERISKWAHLSFDHKWFSGNLHLKFEKEVIF